MFKQIICISLLIPTLLTAQKIDDNLPNCTNIVVWSFSCETKPELAQSIAFDIEAVLTDIKPGCKVLDRDNNATLNAIIKEEGAIQNIKKTSIVSQNELRKLKAETVMFGRILNQGTSWRIEIEIDDLNSLEKLKSNSINVTAQEIQSPAFKEKHLRPLIYKMVGYADGKTDSKNQKIVKEPGTFSSGEKWALAGIGVAGVGSISYGIASIVQGKNLYQTYQDVRYEDAPEYTTESRDDLYERANKKYVTGQVFVIGGTALLAGGAWWLTKKLKEKPKKNAGTSSLWRPNLSLEPLVSSDATQTWIGIALNF